MIDVGVHMYGSSSIFQTSSIQSRALANVIYILNICHFIYIFISIRAWPIITSYTLHRPYVFAIFG